MCDETDNFPAGSRRVLVVLSALGALSLEPSIEKATALNTLVLIALDAILRASKGI